MTDRKTLGFAVGAFALLGIVLLRWLEPILGYHLPVWAIIAAGIAATVAVQYIWSKADQPRQ